VKARALTSLAGQNLRADARGAVLNALGACVGVAALVFFVALGNGVAEVARRIFPGDARLIEVVPAAVSLGSFLGGGKLDDAAVARLGEQPGVERTWPKLNLRVAIAATRPPERLAIGWPRGLVIQVPAVGVDPDLIAADVQPGLGFADPGPDQPIPAVASKRLLEIYNKTLAPSWNMPRLPPGISLVGAQLLVEIGRSFVPGAGEARTIPARLELVGLSDRVPLYAVAIPLDTARRLHAEFGKPDAGYSAVMVQVAHPEDVPKVAAAVRRMGFAVDDSDRALAERVGAVVALTTGALALLALLMCALAALAIAQTLGASVRARRREIAILRAVGATGGDVRGLVLAEAAAIGIAGGLAGVALARLAAWGLDRAAGRLIPDFPFRPDSFFTFPPWIYAAGIAVAVVSAVLGALAPAAQAARLDPARAIS
jgi:hypothetical protein